MSAQLTDEEALNRVASYCSAAEHCRAEVNEKLQRWGIAYETIARILERLETEKYIDDECKEVCRPLNSKISTVIQALDTAGHLLNEQYRDSTGGIISVQHNQ